MSERISRRQALKGTAAALVGLSVLPSLASGQSEPRRRRTTPRVGIIGSGGKGWSGMEGAAQHGQIVALCDVDFKQRLRALETHPSASSFEDYREMLQAVGPTLDAVVISTPDHHHFLASAMAIQMGIHVYCEKPLTHSIWEARELGRLAKKHKVATQMGNQSTASTPMRKVAKLIRDGAFGQVREVHLWTNRAGGWWKQGVDRPAPGRAPKELDFDLWLGPAPLRPFAEGYHPFSWRGWWDFGTGSLGDMGCHIFNMPHMALDLRDPAAVRATTSGHNRDSFPAWARVTYEFSKRGGRDAFQLFWYDGGQLPDARLVPGHEIGGNGSIVVCEKGTVYCPDEGNAVYHLVGGTMPDVAVEESPGHMAEFFRAVGGGPEAVSNFPDYASPLTVTVLLGNLAIWADGARLEWDARRQKVRGTDEFDFLVRREPRRGWSL
ncbi:MAG: Gfo/Idh/MocA family oxidoreductase [Fimbriimonadaceae bacterium]|nr:Gfo/Idh/MocA family oxidoreductase [Fimbriimonadaceae bacterium]QYK58481.1 MAG: Gfo/Idh/MocA family oxidoreductase [Fimbriimonadaceae bacterium]